MQVINVQRNQKEKRVGISELESKQYAKLIYCLKEYKN